MTDDEEAGANAEDEEEVYRRSFQDERMPTPRPLPPRYISPAHVTKSLKAAFVAISQGARVTEEAVASCLECLCICLDLDWEDCKASICSPDMTFECDDVAACGLHATYLQSDVEHGVVP